MEKEGKKTNRARVKETIGVNVAVKRTSSDSRMDLRLHRERRLINFSIHAEC